MTTFIFVLLGILIFWFSFSFLMGYKKGNITLDLDDHYTDPKKYVEAVKQELENQGRTVNYEGNYQFLIDGKVYTMISSNVPMGAPLQRTILKPKNR
ncbi:hypothetical protein [Jeotgalibacillus marinus]|uniref:Uncharacterized protein n=1 Tax=Jeotgalibacillus marinus TaxID=86667 RepID=A0ABV3Q608_9BACL